MASAARDKPVVDEEWTVVGKAGRRRRRDSRTPDHDEKARAQTDSWRTERSSLTRCEVNAEIRRLTSKLEMLKGLMSATSFYTSLSTEVQSRLCVPPDCSSRDAAVCELVCYGLGSVRDTLSPPIYQLACVDLLKAELSPERCVAFDPAFDQVDRALLTSLGWHVLDHDERGKRCVAACALAAQSSSAGAAKAAHAATNNGACSAHESGHAACASTLELARDMMGSGGGDGDSSGVRARGAVHGGCVSRPRCGSADAADVCGCRLDHAGTGKAGAVSGRVFFMPHCPMRLYSNVLWANWSPCALTKIIIAGNRLSGYSDRALPSEREKDPSNCILPLLSYARETPVPWRRPSQNERSDLMSDHRAERAFLDFSLTDFPEVPQESDFFWSSRPPEHNGELDGG